MQVVLLGAAIAFFGYVWKKQRAQYREELEKLEREWRRVRKGVKDLEARVYADTIRRRNNDILGSKEDQLLAAQAYTYEKHRRLVRQSMN